MSMSEQIDYKTLTQGLTASHRWIEVAMRIDDRLLKKALAEASDPLLIDELKQVISLRSLTSKLPGSSEFNAALGNANTVTLIRARDAVSDTEIQQYFEHELNRRRNGIEDDPSTALTVTEAVGFVADHLEDGLELVEDEDGEQAQVVDVSNEEAAKLRSQQLINERAGRRQVINALKKLVTATDILDLQQIKESKTYKGFTAFDGEKWQRITTWKQYCEVVEGRSREAVDLDIHNLNAFGSDLFDAMSQIHVGPGTMRALRKLPDDERSELERMAKEMSKEDFAEAIEAMTEKHIKERDALKKAKDEAETQLNASRGRVEKLTQQVYTLEDEKSARSLQAPEPNAETLRLRKELADFLWQQKAAIQAATNSGIKQLLDHGDANGEDHREFVSGLLVEVEREINILRDLFNIPAAPSASTLPEWAAGLPQDFEGMES